ncbi:aspartic proteinase nepenthesin-1-like [Typha latifolia]|uniref:aspartic proteinase nepenthesin-1-like n=1 Tax=Typha latifolia TaxID=4733 RepID=UPI003C2CFBC9
MSKMIPTLLLCALFLQLVSQTAPTPTSLRISLSHIDSTRNFTAIELLQRALRRSNNRIEFVKATMTSSEASVESHVHFSGGEYLMDLAIGTPQLPYSAILDTGSDLIWTQCQPCLQCFPQPSFIFDPSKSSTFSELSCSSSVCQDLTNSSCPTSQCQYYADYYNGASTQGVLATETFTFAFGSIDQVSLDGILFGCGNRNVGADFFNSSGIVGLGWSPVSLVSQLGSGKFSYCLTSFIDSNLTSHLLLGSLSVINTTSNILVQSTPLLRNPYYPNFYISLLGISIGETLLPIPKNTFAIEENSGAGGMIIDSGTTVTFLEQAGYDVVKQAIQSLVPLPLADGSSVGLDLCFASSSATPPDMPDMILHLDRGNMTLPRDNYMFFDSSSAGLFCLVMAGNHGLSILGNYQQQNFQILYDVATEMLSFVPAQCHLM